MKTPSFLLFSVLFTSILIYSDSIFAQKIMKAQGTAQLKVEGNITKNEAKLMVVELAKINAIEGVFGTYIEQESRITVDSGKADFYIVGNTKVKGVWVREIDRNFTEEYREEQGAFGKEKILWITCTIKGEIKKAITRPAIEYMVLNCQLPGCRTTSFVSGEQLFVKFRSPVNGYLSIYSEDEDGNVFRLLPYSRMAKANSYPIEADLVYSFFSIENSEVQSTDLFIDEIIMETTKAREVNKLIIVFSDEEYFKPGLIKGDNQNIPALLYKTKFEEWLSDNRALQGSFTDISIPLEIFSKK